MKIIMVNTANVSLYKFKVEELQHPGYRQVLGEINSSTVREWRQTWAYFYAGKKNTKFPVEIGLSWEAAGS